MAGGIEHLQFLITETDDIALLHELVGSRKVRLVTIHPESRTVSDAAIIDWDSGFVHQQRHFVHTHAVAVSQNMVNMGMRIDDILYFQRIIFNKISKLLTFDEIAHTWVNDHRLPRVIVKDNRVDLYLIKNENSDFQIVVHTP